MPGHCLHQGFNETLIIVEQKSFFLFFLTKLNQHIWVLRYLRAMQEMTNYCQQKDLFELIAEEKTQ